ncbi:hypothetical protein [Uliginosibacterium aquaticum]|nr:hypothetical protein [Uliginosibacterium aquaticum]
MARFLMLLLSLWALPALAQTDPLRPPPGFFTPGAAPATVEEALRLQGVQLSAGRQRALINGRSLAPGERIGDYRLLSLDAASALLQGPAGRLRLHLLPASQAAPTISSPLPPGGRTE